MRAQIVLVLVLSLFASSVALAQETDEDIARAHFASGRAYYDQGRYEDAARMFLEAYEISPRPELLENASRAYERALMFDEAIQMLQQILSQHSDYPQAGTLRERITNLERLRERLHGQQGGNTDAAPDAGPTAEPTPSGGGGGGISIPGIAVLAAGGAIGIGAIIMGVVSHSMYEDLQTVCSSGGVCPADRQADIDTGNALALTSTIFTFVSIAAIGVGIVLLIVDSGGDGGEQARLELVPGPGQAGVGLRGSF